MIKRIGIPIVGYYAIMAISLILVKLWWGRDYQSEDFNLFFLPFMSLLGIWTGYWCKKRRSTISLKKTSQLEGARGIGFYLILLILILLSVWAAVDGLLSGRWYHLSILALDAILIGLAEEGMFRYYLIGQVQHHMTKPKAVLISSGLFAFLHVFNLLGNMTLDQVANQLVTTVIMGAFLAAAYLVIGRIWPVVLFHSLWDFLIFSDLANQVSWVLLLVLALLPIQLALTIYYSIKLGSKGPRATGE